jgi:hypothetical protein
VLWIVLLVALVLLTVAGRKRGARPKQAWWIGIPLAGLVLFAALRFGPRALVLLVPLAVWLAWSTSGKTPAAGPRDGSRHRSMTREEALRVLGLQEGASAEAIQSAHRTLIKKLHPDQGGSGFLAQQVNEARQVLQRGAR